MKRCPVPFDQTSIYVLLAQQKTRWMHPREGGLTFAPSAAAGYNWSFSVFRAAPAHRLVICRYSGVFCDKQTVAPHWRLQRSGTSWSLRKENFNNRVKLVPRYQFAGRSSLLVQLLPSRRRKEGKVAYQKTHQIWRVKLPRELGTQGL